MHHWQHPSISITSLSLEETEKQENQKRTQSSRAEGRSLCCQQSSVSLSCSAGIYWYRDLHCGLYRLKDTGEKFSCGKREETGGLEKIDGQLSKRERKVREWEQTLQKSAVHWSQQWRGRQRELLWGKISVPFTGWKKCIFGYSRTLGHSTALV